MTKVISILPRHYIGTAAEIAGVTGVCGNTAYETDTDIYKHWNGSAWGVGGLSFYEPLNCAAAYKGIGDFTKDGAWHADGLDLTAIVPAGAMAVNLRMHYKSNGAMHIGRVRQNATTNDESMLQICLQVANVDRMETAIIGLDADRLLDYYFHAATTALSLFVLGYFIRRCL